MGEANELCQYLGKNKTFRVFNNANGDISCDVYQGSKRMPAQKFADFKRELKQLKQEYYLKEQLPRWEVLNDLAKQKNKTLVTRKLEQKKPATEQVSKQDRQESLKQVLKETMNLTMTLKGQLAILARKNIHNRLVQPKRPSSKTAKFN